MSNHDSVLLLHLAQSPKNLIETETKKTLDEEDIVKKNCFHIVTKHFGAASTTAFLP